MSIVNVEKCISFKQNCHFHQCKGLWTILQFIIYFQTCSHIKYCATLVSIRRQRGEKYFRHFSQLIKLLLNLFLYDLSQFPKMRESPKIWYVGTDKIAKIAKKNPHSFHELDKNMLWFNEQNVIKQIDGTRWKNFYWLLAKF